MSGAPPTLRTMQLAYSAAEELYVPKKQHREYMLRHTRGNTRRLDHVKKRSRPYWVGFRYTTSAWRRYQS